MELGEQTMSGRRDGGEVYDRGVMKARVCDCGGRKAGTGDCFRKAAERRGLGLSAAKTGCVAALLVLLSLLFSSDLAGASPAGSGDDGSISFSERLPVRGSEISVHGISYPLFSDNYKICVWDSLPEDEPATVGAWRGYPVEKIAGFKYDYYHVLNTWLVSIQTNTSESSSSSDQSQNPPDAIEAGQSYPAYIPSANAGMVVASLISNQIIESSDLLARFGSLPAAAPNATFSAAANQSEAGGLSAAEQEAAPIELWAFYNGAWTQAPTAVRQNQQMNLMGRNSLVQPLWGFDSGSNPNWTYWGEIGPGFIPSTFFADSKGWHTVRIWGGSSGLSNSLAVYVS